jgi:PAS domain S-box-containing protein
METLPYLSILKATTETSEDIVGCFDRNLRYVYFNRTFAVETEKTYGRTPAIGMSIRELLPPESPDLAKIVAVWERVLAGEGIEAEAEFGAGRRFRIRYTPVRDEAGAVTGGVHVAKEVGAQATLSAALVQSTKVLDSFFFNSPLIQGVVETSDDDILHRADNKKSIAFFGTDPKGKWASELGIQRPVIDAWLAQYRRARETRGPVTFSYQYDRNGSWFDLEVTVGHIGQALESGRPIFSYVIVDVTARLAAERELRAMEFKTLANTINQLCWIADATGTVLWYNDCWYEYTGIAPGDVANDVWRRVIHPDQLPHVEEEWMTAVRDKELYEANCLVRKHTGEYRWFLARAVKLRTEGREPIWFGTNTDVHEHTVNFERAREIIEAIPQGVWRTTADGGADFVSERFIQMVGYSFDELKGENWVALVHDEDRPRLLEVWDRARAERSSVDVSFRVKMKGGGFKWFLSLGTPLLDERGQVAAYYGTWTDVTEQRRNQEELGYQATLTRAITDNAASGLFMMDKRGHPTYMNPAAMGATGYAALEEIKDRPLHYSIHYKKPDGTFYPIEECPIDNANAEVRPVSNQQEIFCRKDGTLFPVTYSVMPIHKEHEIVGAVIEFRDITREKEIEASLREAIAARDEFLSLASHELKTPLTSIRLSGQMMQRFSARAHDAATFEVKTATFLDQIDKQTQRISKLVDDMLDISRIRTGRLRINKEEFDLAEMARDLVERMREEFLAAIGAVPEVNAEGPAIGTWDKFRIEQVLINLLTNALRYGRGKPIAIRVRGLGPAARLEVRDRGIGIDRKNMEIIFERFERGGVSAKEISGLGLGLYITKQIVVAHGGRIWVESTPGEGSTFFVELPRN